VEQLVGAGLPKRRPKPGDELLESPGEPGVVRRPGDRLHPHATTGAATNSAQLVLQIHEDGTVGEGAPAPRTGHRVVAGPSGAAFATAWAKPGRPHPKDERAILPAKRNDKEGHDADEAPQYGGYAHGISCCCGCSHCDNSRFSCALHPPPTHQPREPENPLGGGPAASLRADVPAHSAVSPAGPERSAAQWRTRAAG
jgi:hypothetical protein